MAKKSAGKFFVAFALAVAVILGSSSGAAFARPPANIPSTDTPTITGTTVFGSDLTAHAGSNWTAGTTFTYQWKRGINVISGATGSTYTLQVADIGTTLTVVVTGHLATYNDTPATSAPTATITAATLGLTPTPTLSSPVRVNHIITATIGTWTSGVTTTYQWYLDGSPIAGATNASYTPVGNDYSGSLTFSVTGTKAGYTTVTKTSSAATVALGIQTNQAGVPVVTGDLDWQYTSFLSFDDSGLNWDEGVERTVQWQRDGVDITGATGVDYTVAAEDIGTYIRACETGTLYGYQDVVLCSDAMLATPTYYYGPAPVIIGAPKVGNQLTARTNGWDSDVTFTYQWYSNGSAISGATARTYTPTADQLGRSITVTVVGTKDYRYYPDTEQSASVTVVAGDLTNVGTPSLTGIRRVGETLGYTAGTWDAGVAFTQQWKRDGQVISGATASTYLLRSGDYGHTITVAITGSKAGYNSASQTSAGVVVLSNVPTITGLARVGETLYLDEGSWVAGTSLSYVWKSNGIAIPGETATTLQVTPNLFGTRITAEVTGTRGGYPTIVSIAHLGSLIAPANLDQVGTPSISGGVYFGDVLTVDGGTWTPGVNLTYSWFRSGRLMPGVDGPSYTLQPGDAAASFVVRVTASLWGYNLAVRYSNGFKVVGLRSFASTATPVLSGANTAGSTLVVETAWDTDVTYSYVWRRNSTVIAGATDSSYTITNQDLGARITVVVTGTKDGYKTATKTSNSTAQIRRG
jgi:hypothetical protein